MVHPRVLFLLHDSINTVDVNGLGGPISFVVVVCLFPSSFDFFLDKSLLHGASASIICEIRLN